MTRRHHHDRPTGGVDRLALVAGAVFVGLGLRFLLGSPDVLRWDPGALWPFAAVGVALLLLVPRRRREDGAGGER